MFRTGSVERCYWDYQGYLAVTLLLTENSDLVRMVINSMRQDLTGTNDVFVNLALAAVANIGGREMADSLHQDVYRLLISSATKPSVKKRAALCLLRLFRKNPESLPAMDWADKILPLLDDNDLVSCRVAAREHGQAPSTDPVAPKPACLQETRVGRLHGGVVASDGAGAGVPERVPRLRSARHLATE